MPKPLRILAVHLQLEHALRRLGCEVLSLYPQPGTFDIGREALVHEFRPDAIIQQEVLGPRVILKNTAALSVPLLFYSLDTHLNTFWHAPYGRLFDAVITAHKSMLPELRRRGLKRVYHLPFWGRKIPWRPFKDRIHSIAFVGRVTPERPVRTNFVNFLKYRFSLDLFQDVSLEETFEIYSKTRIVPNEAILGELNFRVFEACSAGALLLNPDIGDEMEGLFEPGREIEVYSDALDLKYILDRCPAEPDKCEKKAYAAWERVNAEHLPIHRAGKLMEIVREVLDDGPGKPSQTCSGYTETLFRLAAAGRSPVSPAELLAELSLLAVIPENIHILLPACCLFRNEEGMKSLLSGLLHSPGWEDDVVLSALASLAALRFNDHALALLFRKRYVNRAGSEKNENIAGDKELYLAWASDLRKKGHVADIGFPFNENLHLPGTAVECLALALNEDGHDLQILARMNALLKSIPGTGHTMLAILSELSLKRPDDWRTGLELGVVNLKSFRLKAGLEEIVLAQAAALEKGELNAFDKILSAIDMKGNIRRFLAELVSGN